MRATISVVRSGAAPEMNELTVNSVQQIRKNRVRPNTPTSQPVAGMTTALAARYEVITHETSSSPAESEPCRCGSTTLVTLVSRICMKATTMTVRVMAHFRPAEIGGGSGGGRRHARSTRGAAAPRGRWEASREPARVAR